MLKKELIVLNFKKNIRQNDPFKKNKKINKNKDKFFDVFKLAVKEAESYSPSRNKIEKIYNYFLISLSYISKLIIKKIKTLIDFASHTSLIWISGLCVMLIVSGFYLSSVFSVALKVSFGGTTLGYISDQNDFNEIKNKVENDISVKTGDSFYFEKLPSFNLSLVKKNNLTDKDEIYTNLYKDAEVSLGMSYGI